METTVDQLSTEEILSAVSYLSLPELEKVFDRVLALQAERKAGCLSAAESVLLARINQGLPAELQAGTVVVYGSHDAGRRRDMISICRLTGILIVLVVSSSASA